MATDLHNAHDEDAPVELDSVAGSSSAEETEIVANALSADYLNFDRDFKPGQQRHLFGLPPEIRNMIYELVVESPNFVNIYKEYAGCSLTLVNRQLRAESLPLYLRLNTFAIDHCTDISHWVKCIGEKNLLSRIRELVVDIWDNHERQLNYYDILVHPMDASEEGCTGISVEHLGDHERGDGCYDVDEFELDGEPTFTDLLRVANNLLWLDIGCEFMGSEIYMSDELRLQAYKHVRTKTVQDPEGALKRYVKRWITELKPRVESVVALLIESVERHRRCIKKDQEEIHGIEERLRYRV